MKPEALLGARHRGHGRWFGPVAGRAQQQAPVRQGFTEARDQRAGRMNRGRDYEFVQTPKNRLLVTNLAARQQFEQHVFVGAGPPVTDTVNDHIAAEARRERPHHGFQPHGRRRGANLSEALPQPAAYLLITALAQHPHANGPKSELFRCA